MGRIAVVVSGLILGVGLSAQAQQQEPQQATPPPVQPQGKSVAGEYGSGVGDAAKGAGKGTGTAVVGAGKATGDLVTLHPVDAAGQVVTSGAKAGEQVGVGAAKGTGHVAKGTGKLVAKPFHHGKKKDEVVAPE